MKNVSISRAANQEPARFFVTVQFSLLGFFFVRQLHVSLVKRALRPTV